MPQILSKPSSASSAHHDVSAQYLQLDFFHAHTSSTAHGRLANVRPDGSECCVLRNKRVTFRTTSAQISVSRRASLSSRQVQPIKSDKVACHALAICTFGLCTLICQRKNNTYLINLKHVASWPIPGTGSEQPPLCSKFPPLLGYSKMQSR